ncbi:MAG: hypothetical protein KJO08_07900 [Gammaproteobacteria bacterium]|nr:hypothetical protein [Gammaproteobacteria bacterium]NNJ83518.1 hypothetical protein [Gammaproteobacteria bacterium]
MPLEVAPHAGAGFETFLADHRQLLITNSRLSVIRGIVPAGHRMDNSRISQHSEAVKKSSDRCEAIPVRGWQRCQTRFGGSHARFGLFPRPLGHFESLFG